MALLGKNILVYRDGVLLAGTRSDEVQNEQTLHEVSTPASSEWREYKPDRKGWQVVTNFLLLTNLSDMLLSVGDKVALFISNGGSIDEHEACYGYAYVQKCVITGTLGNLAQGSFQFVGTGQLKKYDLT